MAKYVVKDTSLIAIAEAIRAKTGKSDPLTLADMPTTIANIETGGGGSSGDVFPTAAPGVYRNGSNFTELIYSWDELIEVNGYPSDFGFPCYMEESSWSDGLPLIWGDVAGDVVLPYGVGHIEITCANVVIPSSIEGIEYVDDYGECFSYRLSSPIDILPHLKTMYIKATTPPSCASGWLYRYNHLTKIVVPKGCANAYKEDTNWCDYAELIVEVDA